MEPMLSAEETSQFFSKFINKTENKECFDCHARGPTWASIPFGVFICFDCSSIHRNMGTHITFVRSIKLDRWKMSQLKYMELGGNQVAKQYFQEHGGDIRDTESKYQSQVGINYKQILDARVKKALKEISPFSSTSSTPLQAPTTPSPLSISTINSNPSTTTSSPMFSTNSSNSNSSFLQSKQQSPTTLDKKVSPQQKSTTTTTATTKNDNDDFDNFFSSSPPKTISTKKVATKKIDQKSFDDDWDSLPDKKEEKFENNNSYNNNNNYNNNNKKKGGSSFKYNNEYIENDEDGSDSKNRSDLSPELRSLYTSSKFSMDFSVDQTSNKQDSSPPLYSQKYNNNSNNNYSNNNNKNYNNNNNHYSNNNNHYNNNNNNYNYNNDRSPNNQSPRNNENKNYQHQNETDYARKNFTNAKSISSSTYYGEDKEKVDSDKQQRISKFTNSKSISSAQYYERDETPSFSERSASNIARELAYNARTDLTSISNKISNIANNIINDLQDRYN
ncbi:hypothetical protein ACTFIU_006102 [Dictyostelium citrinum]